MGLDATVYCDCVEKGKLTIPHPFPDLLHISADGAPEIQGGVLSQHWQRYDAWVANNPCPHKYFWLVHHHLGNVAGIAFVRHIIVQIVKDPAVAFPVLWSKVVYSGIHCGDYLSMDDVTKLGAEVNEFRKLEFERLRGSYQNMAHDLAKAINQGGTQPQQRQETNPPDHSMKGLSPEDLAYLKGVFSALDDLIHASLAVRKPVSF
jgi:hypothetical protein